jgi:hypothetical protein
MYSIGSLIDYKTIYDIRDKIVISFIINDLLFTCGHCLPQDLIFDDNDLSLIYTSGFDNKDENIELGIIKINDINKLSNPYNIKLTKKTNIETYEQIKLLNNDIFYNAINLITLSHNDIKDLKAGQVKICLDDILELHLDHQITKISSNKLLFDKINLVNVLLYISSKNSLFGKRNINQNDTKNINFDIDTDIYYNLTKPSFSGSPLINNENIIIGYHIGSTFGYIVNKLTNKVTWIGRVGYTKKIIFE